MITASIVTYKTDRDELKSALRCVSESNVDKIYIIDNSPTDELQDITELSSKFEYVFGQGNVGYGSAHNIAMKKSIALGAKYHVVINPDVNFGIGTIEELTSYMDTHDNIGQVMPKVIYSDGEMQYLCKLLPSPMDLIGRRFIPIKSYIDKRNYRFEMRSSGYDTEMEVPFLSGCFMFLRVEVIAKIDGFDDNFFMYCEDIDFCRRVGMSGYKTMYYPKVTVVHAHKKESFKSRAMLKEHIKSAIRYFNKWGWFFDSYKYIINKRTESQFK